MGRAARARPRARSLRRAGGVRIEGSRARSVRGDAKGRPFNRRTCNPGAEKKLDRKCRETPAHYAVLMPAAGASSRKRLDPCLSPPQYQCVDIVRPFVGVDHLEVDHVAYDAELVRDPVTAQHVSGEAR